LYHPHPAHLKMNGSVEMAMILSLISLHVIASLYQTLFHSCQQCRSRK